MSLFDKQQLIDDIKLIRHLLETEHTQKEKTISGLIKKVGELQQQIFELKYKQNNEQD